MTPIDAAATSEELLEVFELRHGSAQELGWGPAMRKRFGYFNPDEHYEALVSRLVGEATSWCDVGCGRYVFPSNVRLARVLADRCALLVGVDPDETIAENAFVHEKVCGHIDDYEPEKPFDLVTMRMVAEHVEHPEHTVAALSRLVAPGGLCVVYTVNRWSPIPLATACIPFALHQPIKRWLWRTESKDTFPTRFRMNTRSRLRSQFKAGGFVEAGFQRLDDCRTFSRFRGLQYLELSFRKVLRGIGLGYPENCLLGVYQREA
ncbi:MAG: class I SAM-dependent methyltransferase [Planctomycetota bacterium]|jgi:SAM-dependent methyltransferase|nr:class I SAM-dependent methyltransferase [Planctomycetota bacterium]